MAILWLALFLMMALQIGLGAIQTRACRRDLAALRGTVGVGHVKAGWSRTGRIVILSYKKSLGQVVACREMAGITIFARFKDRPDYVGRDLAAMRALGLAADAREFRFARRRHPYDAAAVSAKKGALIQAVEAIERRLAEEADAAAPAGAGCRPSLHAQARARLRVR